MAKPMSHSTIITAGSFDLAPGTGPFRSHQNRYVHLSVNVDLLGLPTLPDRMITHLRDNLVRRLAEASGEIIVRARRKLNIKPDDVVTPDGNIYGFDTGKMHDTLTSTLVEMSMTAFDMVAYDIHSTEAGYWFWVEFGHMLRNGNWWPGYHFLSSTVIESEAFIRNRVREAVRDTYMQLAAESRVYQTAYKLMP